MAARARGRVVEVNNRGAKFSLDDGKVAVDIVHRPRAQWIFEAGPFRVNVHGTSFTVAWNPVETVFEVRLASGAISVTSPMAGPEIRMRAGQTLRVSLRDQSSSLGKSETMSSRDVPSATDSAAAAASLEPPRRASPGPSDSPRWAHRGWMTALAQNNAPTWSPTRTAGVWRRCSSAPTARTSGRWPMPPDTRVGIRWRAKP